MRSSGSAKLPGKATLEGRFLKLRQAEKLLIEESSKHKLLGRERLARQRILRWAVLQHYEICPTPLLDVTHSLRIAASFASDGSHGKGYVFVVGVPHISGAITASAEAGLQIVRLSSVCPPSAVRPHIQEGYLLGEYPEFSDFEQKEHYSHFEMDFGRRLIAKFEFDTATFWDNSGNFPRVSRDALYPRSGQDPMIAIAETVAKGIL